MSQSPFESRSFQLLQEQEEEYQVLNVIPRAWEPVSSYTSLLCEKFMNDFAFLAWKLFFHELENYT